METIAAALGEAAEHLSVTLEHGVATIELRRPDKHNAISFAMWSAFGRLMPVLADDPAVEVVVLRGTPGGPFSAGADIAEFRTLRADPQGARRYGEAVEAGEQAIIAFPKPTVALIEGFAIGGGTQLAVACDLRVCGEGSRFGVTPARLGIVYALPSTERLVETVGAAWARWILLTGELLDAPTALRIGLVHEVVPDDQVVVRALEVARIVASRAQVSLRGGKAMVQRVVTGRLEEDDEVHAIYEASWASAEYAEGVAAFLGKRAPDFPAARARQR
ncbi:MAG: enoyl-CoA hydratase-related protein [Candidatus Nanopelagicales bacterium]|jgi:enoyl-CoA hydratase/carnithine racemase|nr:enoyl-CoA hydratase-related protein [Candidatus Nanopelagicales bacterium]